MLEEATSTRMPNIQQDPRFEGWPEAHPKMRSFLGVPVVLRGEVVAAFYVTDKIGPRGAEFDAADQRVIEALAPHAAVALENAQLLERSRELTLVEERNRLARELHDAVCQTLFSAILAAEVGAMLVTSDPDEAKRQIEASHELTRSAVAEMRALVFELRPADIGSDGLAATLGKHVDVLRRVHATEIALSVDGVRALEPRLERETFRIAQEALANALKHGAAEHVRIGLSMPDGSLRLLVADDGAGFELGSKAAGRHLGLVSMRERAEAIGGRLEVESRPGAGTRVSFEVALG
jgi:signal transduction histidine kinase